MYIYQNIQLFAGTQTKHTYHIYLSISHKRKCSIGGVRHLFVQRTRPSVDEIFGPENYLSMTLTLKIF